MITRTTVAYIAPVSQETDDLILADEGKRAFYQNQSYEFDKITGSINLFEKTYLAKNNYIELDIRNEGNFVSLYGKLTPLGRQALEILKSGLVWSIKDHGVSRIATKMFYNNCLQPKYPVIRTEVFQLINNITDDQLLSDIEFINIRSELMLFKLRSSKHVSTVFWHSCTQEVWTNNPEILNQELLNNRYFSPVFDGVFLDKEWLIYE